MSIPWTKETFFAKKNHREDIPESQSAGTGAKGPEKLKSGNLWKGTSGKIGTWGKR